MSLPPEQSKRYKEKIDHIGGQDPYEVPNGSLSQDPKFLPSITYPDIVNYLIFNQSHYTKDELKAYKGLDAYQLFVSGWVREMGTLVHDGNCLVKAKVRPLLIT